MKLITFLEKPTDIIIAGTRLKECPYFNITDDYYGINLKASDSRGRGVWMETEGSASICTVDHFKKHYQDIDFAHESVEDLSDEYFVFLPQQQGSIQVVITKEDSEDGTNNDITPPDLDLEKDILYQVDDMFDIEDVKIILDRSTRVKRFSWEDLLEFLHLS